MAVQGKKNSLTLRPGGKNLVKSLADILANSLRIKTGNRRGQNQLILDYAGFLLLGLFLFVLF